MNIIPFNSHHSEAVLNLLNANTPEFFAAEEKAELINYLEKEREDYFVVEENDEIIGAGGINYFLKDRMARISWDMIHPDYHGKGIGTQLIKYRIDLITKNPEIDTIVVRTSQHVHAFYEKVRFQLDDIQRDFWARGYDLYLMRKSV